jgi:hypothetical protein
MIMPKSTSSPLPIPPDIARYLKGSTPQTRQFDFLVGNWDVVATRYKEDGSILFQYAAAWNAKSLNEGRMIIDDFKARGPSGDVISSFVTLRTYCEVTQRWEMAGLAALQPAAVVEWHGVWQDNEMLLDAIGNSPNGKPMRTKIRFHDIESNTFAWESKTSLDEGKSWTKTASLLATRTASHT